MNSQPHTPTSSANSPRSLVQGSRTPRIEPRYGHSCSRQRGIRSRPTGAERAGDICCCGCALRDSTIPPRFDTTRLTFRHCRQKPDKSRSITSIGKANGTIGSITSWNSWASILYLSHYWPPSLNTASGIPVDRSWNWKSITWGYTPHSTPAVSRPRSNCPSPLRCSGNPVLMPARFLKSSPCSHKV